MLGWHRDSNGKEDWYLKCPLEQDRPLFNMPDIINNADKVVIIGEGEKAASALNKLFPSFIATTSSSGARSAFKTDWTILKDRDVVLSLDYDEAGKTYGCDVLTLCKYAGAKSVKLLPTTYFSHYHIGNNQVVDTTRELPQGYDLTDALAEDWTADHKKPLRKFS